MVTCVNLEAHQRMDTSASETHRLPAPHLVGTPAVPALVLTVNDPGVCRAGQEATAQPQTWSSDDYFPYMPPSTKMLPTFGRKVEKQGVFWAVWIHRGTVDSRQLEHGCRTLGLN